MNVLLILGNQLFPTELLQKKSPAEKLPVVFMREDHELCTHFRYHQQKIVFFLAAMRAYADELRAAGFTVHYEQLGVSDKSFEESLAEFLTLSNAKHLSYFEIEDKFFAERIEALSQKLKISTETWISPMFLTTHDQFKHYLREVKKPMMKSFYERQRKRLKIMVDRDLKPVGGQWSFDEDNREPLPKNYIAPPIPQFEKTAHEKAAIQLVQKYFSSHPGDAAETWLPTERENARAWLADFWKNRFRDFGPYEDALAPHSPFLNHSILTPFLNVGLLTPAEVIRGALKVAVAEKIPLNSAEGFIRQVIGWREFIRGIYQQFSEQQESSNFWGHHRLLSSHWYSGKTGIAPLDDVIKKTLRYGYAHHIERLMVVGCLMLLLEVKPTEAHRWFMEMYIDSSDWVMGPNVFGMALFSDGGIFATKPYICGSNYYRKMGGYKGGDWQDGVDGLYWSFIERHKTFFLKNPRLSMAVRSLEKMDAEKKHRLYKAADELREKLTLPPPPGDRA